MDVLPAQLFEVLDKTWPAATRYTVGPWVIRKGAGGGQRVSAATTQQAMLSVQDIEQAENAMRRLGQPPVFMIRDQNTALDDLLARRGYPVVDPCNLYAIRSDVLAAHTPPAMTTFDLWEPLAVMLAIWAEGGIGPKRIDVMRRVKGPKTVILGRIHDQPAGTAFVAGYRGVAMLHALEIRKGERRLGLGRFMMWHAASWVVSQGMNWLTVICTQKNDAANGLYRSLGMDCVAQYHYRRTTP